MDRTYTLQQAYCPLENEGQYVREEEEEEEVSNYQNVHRDYARHLGSISRQGPPQYATEITIPRPAQVEEDGERFRLHPCSIVFKTTTLTILIIWFLKFTLIPYLRKKLGIEN